MKRLFSILATFVLALTATSCENHSDMIVDWAPLIIRVYVQDTQGNDLLDPTNYRFMASEVSAEWRGTTSSYTYPGEIPPYHQTRAYLPHFEGVFLSQNAKGHYIYFGELMGNGDYNDDLIIHWNDGSKDVIHINNKANERTLKVKRSYTLNGKKCDNPIVITRK